MTEHHRENMPSNLLFTPERVSDSTRDLGDTLDGVLGDKSCLFDLCLTYWLATIRNMERETKIELTPLGQHPLVVHDCDILLGEIDDLVVLDLP